MSTHRRAARPDHDDNACAERTETRPADAGRPAIDDAARLTDGWRLICPACGGEPRRRAQRVCRSCAAPYELLPSPAGGIAYPPARLSPLTEGMARWLGLSATPLVPSGTLGGLFGLGSLSFKLESRNPAGSWLDRSGALAVAAAYADGAAGLLTWSSVALATALALSANRLRLRTVFLQAVRPDPPPWPAVLATLGAQVVRVDTTQGALQRAAPALARRHGLQVLDADDPFVRAGLWTLPFEIADDAEPRPDLVILPRLAGNEADWCRRGFEIWSALAGGPSPRVVAALVGERTHLPAELAACDEVSVLPREVGAARRLLARQEGLLASTSGAAGVAALARMAHAKVLPLGARVVVVLAAEYGADVCQPPAAEEQPALTPISLTALRRDADRVLMTPPM